MPLLLNIFLIIIIVLAVFLVITVLLILLLPLQYQFRFGYQETDFFAGGVIKQGHLYSLRFNYQGSKGAKPEVRLKIFFIPLPSLSLPEKKEKVPKKKEGPEEKRDGKKAAFDGRVGKVLLRRQVLAHVLELIKDLVVMVRPQRLEIGGTVGFEEPHLVGWLWAFLWSLKGLFPGGVIDLESLWDEEYYDVRVMMAGNIIPGVMFLRLLRFLLSKRTMKVARDLRKFKKPERAAA